MCVCVCMDDSKAKVGHAYHIMLCKQGQGASDHVT